MGWNLKKVSAEAHADLTKSLIEFESVQIVRAYKVFLSLLSLCSRSEIGVRILRRLQFGVLYVKPEQEREDEWFLYISLSLSLFLLRSFF